MGNAYKDIVKVNSVTVSNISPDIKIKISGLTKIFGPKAAEMLQHTASKTELLEKYDHTLGLNNINMQIQARKIEVIMGLSGSGKSTLIRHINRLIEPTSGTIEVDGENILDKNEAELREFRRKKTAMVFQNFALFPHKNIFDNVSFGMIMQGRDPEYILEKASFWIERVGLKGVEKQYPAQLSGGMQQRVGLARALACDTDILMMDEAFSALDPLIRSDMQDLLLELQSELHKTVVFITHDLDEALKIGDRIAILKDGELVQHGSPQEILLKPANEYVRRFVADVNRTRVLLAKSIMVTEEPSDLKQAISINQNETVDAVLHALLSEDGNSVIVENNKGVKVGYIDKETLAEAVFSQKKKLA